MKIPEIVEPYDPDMVDQKFLDELYKNTPHATRYVQINPTEVDRNDAKFKAGDYVHENYAQSTPGVIVNTYLVESWIRYGKSDINSRKPVGWALHAHVRFLPKAKSRSSGNLDRMVDANTLQSYDKVIEDTRKKMVALEEKVAALEAIKLEIDHLIGV